MALKGSRQAPYFLDEIVSTASMLRLDPSDARLRDELDRGIRETDEEIQFAAWLAAEEDDDLLWGLRRVGWLGLDATPIAKMALPMDVRASVYLGLRLEEVAASRDDGGVVELLACKGYKATVDKVPDLIAGAVNLDLPLGHTWTRVMGEIQSRLDESLRDRRDDPVAVGLSAFLRRQFAWIQQAQHPEAFRRARAATRLKASQLAVRMGVSYQLVYGFETGQFPIPFRHRRRLDQITRSDRRPAA